MPSLQHSSIQATCRNQAHLIINHWCKWLHIHTIVSYGYDGPYGSMLQIGVQHRLHSILIGAFMLQPGSNVPTCGIYSIHRILYGQHFSNDCQAAHRWSSVSNQPFWTSNLHKYQIQFIIFWTQLRLNTVHLNGHGSCRIHIVMLSQSGELYLWCNKPF